MCLSGARRSLNEERASPTAPSFGLRVLPTAMMIFPESPSIAMRRDCTCERQEKIRRNFEAEENPGLIAVAGRAIQFVEACKVAICESHCAMRCDISLGKETSSPYVLKRAGFFTLFHVIAVFWNQFLAFCRLVSFCCVLDFPLDLRTNSNPSWLYASARVYRSSCCGGVASCICSKIEMAASISFCASSTCPARPARYRTPSVPRTDMSSSANPSHLNRQVTQMLLCFSQTPAQPRRFFPDASEIVQTICLPFP